GLAFRPSAARARSGAICHAAVASALATDPAHSRRMRQRASRSGFSSGVPQPVGGAAARLVTGKWYKGGSIVKVRDGKPSKWITVADDSGISATRFERLVPWRQSASFRLVYS